MNHRHLADDRLIEMCLGGPVPVGDEEHLVTCAACEARRAALTQLLDDVHAAVTAEADAAFPADRLARQQMRILHRVEQDGRPGRVIAFPAGALQEPAGAPPHPRPATGWVAAAAAAGLIVGLLAGHAARDLPGAPESQSPAVQSASSAPAGTGGTLRAISAISEDEFLGQIELAIESGGPAVLRPLDALTPRAWDVR